MGGGGGVGRGEFFGGNIRSGWRKCVFEGKKGFLGKMTLNHPACHRVKKISGKT